uniref:cystatin-B-like n=1 Tax=Myxine glutinosa TaxID=7769 RepID=UPI00358EFDFF
MAMMCGGVGCAVPANAETQAMCDQVKVKVEEHTGKKFDKFVAVSFKEQCVSGTNFFIQVDIGNEEYLHFRVHKALTCDGGKLSLHSVQEGKRQGDEIKYF